MMYHAYETQADAIWPLRALARLVQPALAFAETGFGGITPAPQRRLAAACGVLHLAQITHSRPAWNIDCVTVDRQPVAVSEEAPFATPFATLRRFRRHGVPAQPKVLVVAPMSGHFATLLRETVRTLLGDHDVYVTDWHNVRDVALREGPFGLDEYTRHVIDFLAHLGPGAHVLAICQPCVAALAAVALMAEDRHPAVPLSLTLMGGPIDCRVNPTEVNRLASSKPIEWFEKNLISTVPWRHRGAGRRVYPGFVQLGAFMSMNRERHLNAFKDYFTHLVAGHHDKAEITRTFYEEYFAVADLSADFYLETVQRVFQDCALAEGRLTYRGRKVDPAAIRRTALLTIEGERDDICAVGQTLAAQDLCSRIPDFLRTHYVQPGVGHYGVFSGKRWQSHVYPVVREVIHSSQ
jgi:poly(3-hydroxybutyrate) depolymerase